MVVADDDPHFLTFISEVLTPHHVGPIDTIPTTTQLLDHLRDHPCDLVIVDFGMKNGGLSLIADIVKYYPYTSIIICTGTHDVATAVKCLQHGAYDYLVKPIHPAQLIEASRRALGRAKAPALSRVSTATSIATTHDIADSFPGFLTVHPELLNSLKYLQSIAHLSVPILLTGPTGTGKEMLAEALHRLSGRKGNCVSMPCAGQDDATIAAHLFGSTSLVKGSTTNSMMLRASGGTVVIDDIDLLPVASQVSLVRLIHNGRYYPVDGQVSRVSSARILTTSCSSLTLLENSTTFRRDLLYSLRAHSITIPALRDRPCDIPILINHYVNQAATELGRDIIPIVSDPLMEAVSRYAFPGNVRELRSLVYDACVLSQGPYLSDLPFLAAIQAEYGKSAGLHISYGSHIPTLREARNHLVNEALRAAGGNQAGAAAILGITRQAVSQLILKRKRRPQNQEHEEP